MSDIDIELEPARVGALLEKLCVPVRDHLAAGPKSPARVLEALNALAALTALVIKGADSPSAEEFFAKALKQHEDICTSPTWN